MKSLLSLYFSIEISTFPLLFFWNLYFLSTRSLKSLLSLIIFLLKSLLSLFFSIEISTFSLLFFWNLYFLITFLLKSKISTFSSLFNLKSRFSLLFYWNLYFLFTFLLQSLLSLYFSIGSLCFLFTFLLKSLLALRFSFEISFFFALQARATSDRSRQLRRQDKAIQYSVHKEAYWESYVSLRKSQLASQVQK